MFEYPKFPGTRPKKIEITRPNPKKYFTRTPLATIELFDLQKFRGILSTLF